MTLKLYTSRYQSQALIQKSGLTPVSTSVGSPRFHLQYTLLDHLAEITPPREIIHYGLERYRPLYLAKLEKIGVAKIIKAMEAIVDRSKKDGLVLLCYEDIAKEFCHRRLFAEWIEEKAGIVIPELTLAHLSPAPPKPKSPAVVQVGLFDAVGEA